MMYFRNYQLVRIVILKLALLNLLLFNNLSIFAQKSQSQHSSYEIKEIEADKDVLAIIRCNYAHKVNASGMTVWDTGVIFKIVNNRDVEIQISYSLDYEAEEGRTCTNKTEDSNKSTIKANSEFSFCLPDDSSTTSPLNFQSYKEKITPDALDLKIEIFPNEKYRTYLNLGNKLLQNKADLSSDDCNKMIDYFRMAYKEYPQHPYLAEYIRDEVVPSCNENELEIQESTNHIESSTVTRNPIANATNLDNKTVVLTEPNKIEVEPPKLDKEAATRDKPKIETEEPQQNKDVAVVDKTKLVTNTKLNKVASDTDNTTEDSKAANINEANVAATDKEDIKEPKKDDKTKSKTEAVSLKQPELKNSRKKVVAEKNLQKTSVEFKPTDKIKPEDYEIGIYQIIDERSNIDYSQLFLNYLAESALVYNDNALHPKLIDHFSRTDISFKLNIKSVEDCTDQPACDLIVLTLYENGKKKAQEIIDSECIAKNIISRDPLFSMEYEEVETDVYMITSVPEDSPEEKANLEVGNYFVHAYVSGNKAILKVKKEIEDKKWKTYKIKMPIQEKYSLSSHISINNMDCLFHELKQLLTKHLDVVNPSKKGKVLKTTNHIDNLMPSNESDYPSRFLPGIHPNAISVMPTESYFSLLNEREQFVLVNSKNNKKLYASMVGNSALNNHIYYNKSTIDHKLDNQNEVSEQLKEIIKATIVPFQNKPGVVVNYINSGDEYYDSANYEAALNQYNAAYRKIGSSQMSKKFKVLLKKTITEKISLASARLEMTNYTKLLEASTQLYSYSVGQLNFNEDHYYNAIDTLTLVCTTIEKQIKKKKKKKLWGVIKGVAAVGAGTTIASTAGFSDFGIDMATEFVATGIQVVTDDMAIANEISNSIYTSTNALNINSEAFEEQGDDLKIELYFFKALVETLDKNKNDDQVLNILRETFGDTSKMVAIVEQLDLSKDLMDSNNSALLRQIGQLEKSIFNYEVRNLSLPEKFKL